MRFIGNPAQMLLGELLSIASFDSPVARESFRRWLFFFEGRPPLDLLPH